MTSVLVQRNLDTEMHTGRMPWTMKAQIGVVLYKPKD